MEKPEEISQDSKIYEVGFHLVPTIAEDAVPAEFNKIKDIIKKEGGEVISEGTPELKPLAYQMSKTVKAIKSNYTKAYFGWVKFSVTPEAILNLKNTLDASESVLRYLITSTVKESTLFADKVSKPTSKTEDIDKTIDDLVIN